MLLLDYWLPLKGYEKYYIGSFSGSIRNHSGEYKKYHLDKNGYPCVNVPPKGNERVHRLIALTFIPNLFNKSDVNHRDEIKVNNNANNFEWLTRQEHLSKHKRKKFTMRCCITKGKVILDLGTGIFYTSDELASIIGIERRYVSRMLRGERKPNTTQYRYV